MYIVYPRRHIRSGKKNFQGSKVPARLAGTINLTKNKYVVNTRKYQIYESALTICFFTEISKKKYL